MDAKERDYLLKIVSDLSKEAYGYRVRLDYDSLTDAELAAICDRYDRIAANA